jgi:hypothetical protein
MPWADDEFGFDFTWVLIVLSSPLSAGWRFSSVGCSDAIALLLMTIKFWVKPIGVA